MKSIVIYTTKYGTAEKAAKMLASKMPGEVTLVNAAKEKTPNLDQYETVILGGSILMGKIQKALTDYMKNNLPALLEKRTGLFICAGQEESIREKELVDSFPPELFERALAKEVFGYEYCLEKMGFLNKFILKKVAGVTQSKYELCEEKIDKFVQTMSAT